MPKVGKKLKVVDVKTELEIAQEQPKEVTPFGEADVEKQPLENPLETPTEAVVMKPKTRARAKSKAKATPEKVEEAAGEVEEAAEEEVAEVKEEEVAEEAKEEVAEEAKEEVHVSRDGRDLVQCPRCQKWLTPKGLKYSHKCPADKPAAEPTPTPKVVERVIEKRVIERAPKVIREKADYSNIPEEIIQKEIEKRRTSQKEQRSIKKAETMKRLSMNIA
jgi:hypothetical protein